MNKKIHTIKIFFKYLKMMDYYSIIKLLRGNKNSI